MAHIEIDYTKYDISTTAGDDFNTRIKRLAVPGETFKLVTTKLFNEYEEELPTKELLTRNKYDEYVYNPTEIIEYEPDTFLYNATIKKNLVYSTANNYNINVVAIDDPDSLDLSQRMAKILINPSQRGMLPPNISINNNSLDGMQFTNMSFLKADFAFIESYNGLMYCDIGNIEDTNPENIISHNDYFDYNVNMWIGCDVHDIYEYENIGRVAQFKLKNPILMNNTYIDSDIVFDTNSINVSPGIVIHNIFESNLSPILILEHLGKGFEIISHNNVLKNIETNRDIIYEVLTYCYLNSYKKTPNIKEWITTEVPDYEVSNNSLKRKENFISSFDINKYFGLKTSERSLYNIDIIEDNNRTTVQPNTDLYNTNNNISYVGMTGGRPIFEKSKADISSYNSEPVKPIGWKSIYNKGKIQYVNKIHYVIETDISNNIITSESGNDLSIKILPFKSSVLGINRTMPTDVNIPFVIAENNVIKRIRIADYILFLNSNNILKFCFKEDFIEQEDTDILAEVHIRQTPDTVNITDMRQLGGGLVDDSPNINYNLLDIGHINGRPYRKAGTSVVTMPKKYEQYREQIEAAVNKAKVSEELIVVLFKDKTEEGI